MRVHLRSRDKDGGGYIIRSAVPENPMLHANITALRLIELELLPIEVLHCGNMNFRPFPLLWPWPWPDNLHRSIWTRPIVRGDVYRMCKYKLPTPRLSKVIVWRHIYIAYTQTDRQTRPKLYTTPLRGWSCFRLEGNLVTKEWKVQCWSSRQIRRMSLKHVNEIRRRTAWDGI